MTSRLKDIVVCDLEVLEADLEAFLAANGYAASTNRSYEHSLRLFRDWCDSAGRCASPAAPVTVQAFLGDMAARSYSRSYIEVALAAIKAQHRRDGLPIPVNGGVGAITRGIRRVVQREARQGAPLTAPLAMDAADAGPEPSAAVVRNRTAVLLAHARGTDLGSALGFGSDEVVAGLGEFLHVEPDGLLREVAARIIADCARAATSDDAAPTAPAAAALRALPLARAAVRAAARRAGVEIGKFGNAGVRLPIAGAELARLLVFLHEDEVTFRRDRAFVLFGHAGAFRAGELLGLRVQDVTVFKGGAVVLIRRSKTDQEGRGQFVGIHRSGDPAYCPVFAVERWVELARLGGEDVLFPPAANGVVQPSRQMSTQMAKCIVRKLTGRAGLVGTFGGNSLRRGYCTSAAEAGSSLLSIAITTRHRTLGTTRRYIGSSGSDFASREVGL